MTDLLPPTPRDEDDAGILADAATLLHNGWCTGAWAINKHGVGVNPRDITAEAWSTDGAITAACSTHAASHRAEQLTALIATRLLGPGATRHDLTAAEQAGDLTLDAILAALKEGPAR